MRKAIFIVAIVLMGAGAKSQDVAPTDHRVLTYDDAIKLALRNGILLNQQRNNLEYNQMQKY